MRRLLPVLLLPAAVLVACYASRPAHVRRYGGERIPWSHVRHEYRTFARCMGWDETPPKHIALWRLSATAATADTLGMHFGHDIWVRGGLGPLELQVLRHEWVHANLWGGDPRHAVTFAWQRAQTCGAIV